MKKLLLLLTIVSLTSNAQNLSFDNQLGGYSTNVIGSNENANNAIQSDIIWEQLKTSNGGTFWSVVSDHFEGADYGIYATDDLSLDNETRLDSVKVSGTQILGTLETVLLGFNVYIYNDVNNLPDGDPSISSAGLYEILNVTSDSGFLTIETSPTNASDYEVTIDLAGANGSEINLPAGTYWISVFPTLDLTENDGLLRWTWYQSFAPALLSQAKMIDPTGATGLGIENWTNITTVGLPMESVAFTLYGEEILSVTDFSNSQVSVYPNPVNNIINLSAEKNIEKVEIFNMLGQRVFDKVLNTTQGSINVEFLSQGAYLMKASVDGVTGTYKVIKN